jgi:MFS family permease
VLATATLGICGTALCAAAPGLAGFTAMQVLARGFVTATAVIAAVLGVEEMPAAARAWASSLLVAFAGLGSGVSLVLLPLADADERAWRLIYLVPLVVLPALPWAARRLPESRRFIDTVVQRRAGTKAPVTARVIGRFATLAVWAALLAFFSSPSRQFMNDFLRDERGFTGMGLTVFGLLTNLPGIVGVVVGGRLADRHGRRPVIGIGLIVFAGASSVMFLTSGPTMWAAATVGSLAGATVLPAISIYGPELFPTDYRSRATGLLSGGSRIGSAIGLTLAGALSDGAELGPVLAFMASALIISALILIFLLPETARRELEELSDPGP